MNSICFVNDFFLMDKNVVTTGPMVQIYLIGTELARRGWRVAHVVTTRNAKDDVVEEHEGMQVHYLPHHRYGGLLSSCKFISKLRDINADLYYQRGRDPVTGLAAYTARKLGKKFIWSAAGEGGMARNKYTNEQLMKKKGSRKLLLYPFFLLQDKLYAYGMENADIVFAQTEYQLGQLKKEFGRDGIVFRSGHSVPGPEVLEKPSPPLVLWVGAIKKQKQPELFLELAKSLSGEKAEFCMLGRILDEHYRGMITLREREQDKFHYAGEVAFEDTSGWFSRASLVINTSEFEGLPNVYIQSWLHGVPVVSLHSDPDQIMKKNNIGYQTGNFDDMVNKVRMLLRNDELRAKMGLTARNVAAREFGIEKLVDRFIDICKAIHAVC